MQLMMETRGLESSPITPQMFANAGREHMEKYGMYVCVYCCVEVVIVYTIRCIFDRENINGFDTKQQSVYL